MRHTAERRVGRSADGVGDAMELMDGLMVVVWYRCNLVGSRAAFLATSSHEGLAETGAVFATR